jgi:Na+/H+-dicarboxylate symporter
MPIILILATIFSILLNPVIPYEIKSTIYACSLTIKSVVLFILPFIIFGLLFRTFVKLSNQAVGIFFLIFGSLCISNFFNTLVSGYAGSLLYGVNFDLNVISDSGSSLEPRFLFLIPNFIKNEIALVGGIVAGLATVAWNKKLALSISEKMDFVLKKLFSVVSLLVPLFVVGFVLKCASDGNLTTIIKNYSQILLIFIVYASIYVSLFFFVACKFSLADCLANLKNMVPAWLTAFSTMSSALTMPVTILSAEKNAKNKELAGSVVSATVNIHLLGDCLAIPLLAYAILKSYGLESPSIEAYLAFTIFFVIAKFSVAAVPAGGIIVMTPILEKYLNFTPEMSDLIIAIYIVFDPFVTGFNVLGNGALAKLIDNIYLGLVVRRGI